MKLVIIIIIIITVFSQIHGKDKREIKRLFLSSLSPYNEIN